ncbi:hypothetical protein SAY87_030014 [Trapa incisa]|uniref:AP2/ERF domain-containing protein n=1 Tax=Trapa incisa TaxID=236973 RepID=A0AAN7KG83_9MYRT|nr:hypothetical protein SAY87_030014 [Trapa incisa]
MARENRPLASMGAINGRKKKSGRRKFNETRHPIYKGVRARNGKWVSEMRACSKSRIWLGTFDSPDEAARAYDAAAWAIRGDSASLNFPRPPPASTASFSNSPNPGDGDDLRTSLPSSSSSSSSLSLNTDEGVEEKSSRLYFDEDEIFDMPGLMVSMAEGLMIAPPAILDYGLGQEDDQYFSPSSAGGSRRGSRPLSSIGIINGWKKKWERRKYEETRHPFYRGVRERNGKWVCEMGALNQKSRVLLGTFDSHEEAAKAYDPPPPPASTSSFSNIQSPRNIGDSPRTTSPSSYSFRASCSLFVIDGMVDEKGTRVYFDEEEIFDMPGLMASMAQGLMIDPPAVDHGFSGDDDYVVIEDLILWRN